MDSARRSLSTVLVSFAAACSSGSSGAAATPPELPSAPQDVYATAGAKSVTLQWTAPVSTFGQKVISYAVVPDPNAAPVTTTAASATISGLTNGTPYVFEVTATTANGTGPAALSNIVIPGGGATASPPVGVVAVARDAEARVSWAAPASPGGSTITGYWVTVTPGGAGQPCKATSLLLEGLTNGTTYVFSVEALNSGGASMNATSNPVTPEADAGLFDGGALDGAATSIADAGVHDAGPRDVGAHDATEAGHMDAAAREDGRSRDAHRKEGHDAPRD